MSTPSQTALGIALILLVSLAVVVHCDSDSECDPLIESCSGVQGVRPRCDPEGRGPCPDRWFICSTDTFGGMLCEEQGDSTPPGDGWECEEAGSAISCVSEREGLFGPGSSWECSEYPDGEVVCRLQSYWPDIGEEETWSCYYEGVSRICHSRGHMDSGDGDSDDIGDECPPGIGVATEEVCGDGIDNDCNGRIDDFCCPPEDSCVCIVDSWRFCDTPDYCLWGRQYCDNDQMAWGPCLEITDIPEICAGVESWYSPRAEACCLENGHCCQDMWDLNHNGDTWESLGNCPELLCDEY